MSPAVAIAWEFRQRHRWGLIAVIAYFVVVATIKLVVVARGLPIYLDSGESFAFVVMAPMTATFTYFLAVFTFGLDGDLAARQSPFQDLSRLHFGRAWALAGTNNGKDE